MKLTRLAPLALGGVLLAGGFAGASLAQQPPPPAQGAAHVGHPGGPRVHRDPEAMAAKRAERLRDVLQLRPEQEPALKAFLASHKRPAGMAERGRGGREQFAAMTTPQRLDAQRARLVERTARFDRHAAATKTFYAQLSPSQQKAFDAMGPRGGMKGGDHRGMGGRGHGPMGGGRG
ncbi:MAG: Spy/CpxP family protein refolding chaperone [Pseudomonadota bacterium]